MVQTMTTFENTMLDKHYHARILQDIPGVCTTAGVQPKFLHTSMKEHCGEVEVEWVRNFHMHERKGETGLMLLGVKRPDSRCQAIAGALLRNFTDARVIPLNTLLDTKEAGMSDGLAAHVLLIPNLFVVSSGKAMPSYKVQQVYDLLLSRSVQGKSTVVYVEDMTGLQNAYGAPFADFLSSFQIISK